MRCIILNVTKFHIIRGSSLVEFKENLQIMNNNKKIKIRVYLYNLRALVSTMLIVAHTQLRISILCVIKNEKIRNVIKPNLKSQI